MKKLVYLVIGLMVLSSNIILADEQSAMISNQVNMLYAENRIEETFNLLLTIPEEERTPLNWLLLGNVLEDKNRDSDAEFMYNQALLTDKKFYKAHYNLGNLYLKQDKPNMAIEQFKSVIKLKPDFAYAYYNMGCAYLKLNQYKKARKYFLDALSYNTNVADFHYNLAYTYKMLNNEKQAKIYLDYYNKITQ